MDAMVRATVHTKCGLLSRLRVVRETFQCACGASRGAREAAMSREELLAQLVRFAGPLGPETSVETFESARQAWHAALCEDDVAPLIEILEEPPAEVRAMFANDWWCFDLELHDAIFAAGGSAPRALFDRAVRLLDHEEARPVAIDLLGSVRLADGVAPLARMFETASLTSDEKIRLACTLGEIRGEEARALLARMREKVAADEVELADEIAMSFDRL